MTYLDSVKQKEAQKRHYITNKDEYACRRRQRDIYLRAKLSEYMVDKFCETCGENRRPTLQFDHLNRSDKFACISKMIQRRFTWDKILSEINKCRILCANCHAMNTASQMAWYRDSAPVV